MGAVPPPLQDDNISMISCASSAATSFAGGERAIEVYLRETRVIVNADIKIWKAKVEAFAGKKQHEIELMDDEDVVTAAEDCDQLKRSIGKQLKTWVMEACDHLTITDPLDRDIRYRMAKYIARKGAMFKKHGFLMEEDAKRHDEWLQCCILPSEEFILNQCRIQEVPTTDQDELLLGAEASGLQLQGPLNVRGRSRSPADQQRARLAALAAQMAKEKEEHERRMTAERLQIAALGRQLEEKKRMRQALKQKEEEARKAAREEEKRQEEEERQVNLAILQSRKAYDEEALRSQKEMEDLRRTLQLQRTLEDVDEDVQRANKKKKTPLKGKRTRQMSHHQPQRQDLPPLDIDNNIFFRGATNSKTPAGVAMEHQGQRRLNNLVDGDVTIAISEESTMRRKMMALQRAQESRPAKKFNNGDSLAFRSLMSRFEAAVNDAALDDASRLFELFHWFEGPAAAMIDSFASLPDAKQAYKSARDELKNVFGASSDTVVPLIRELLAGNAVKEDNHQAHLLLYSQLVTADTTATLFGQRNLLDRFGYCAEVVEKRLPHLAERWWRKDHEHQVRTGSRFAFSH